MILRDYQTEGSEFLQTRRRGFVIAPAGSGKTIIGAHALSRRLGSGMSALWIANTKEQVEQAGVAISAMPGATGTEISVCCAAADPDPTSFDIIVFDEAHHLPATTWLDIASKGSDRILWGLSATPWHEDELRNLVVRSAFQEFFEIKRDRVMASGHLVPGKVYLHDLDRPGQFDAEIERRTVLEVQRRSRAFPGIAVWEHQRRAQWQITQEVVQANENRNGAIVALAVQESSVASVLILVFSIEHGEKLAAQIPGAVVVHSKLPKKRRAEVIAGFRAGTIPVMVSTSLADEGLDVPRAEVLILAAGGRSAGKLEQRAGRVLRPFAGKVAGRIHDFYDRGAVFANAQARSRMGTYERLGYEPEIRGY